MKIQILISLTALSFLFSACGGGDNNSSGNGGDNVSATDSVKYIKIPDAREFLPSWSKSNTLVYHDIGEPDDMHPTNGNSAARSEIFLYTQMFLIGTDFRELKPRPSLVKSMPEISADGLKYTYELREEPRWDDGSSLTAEDIIFTLKANKCPLTNNPHAKPYLENLKEIEVDPANPRKITFVMKKEYIQNITFLGDYPVMQRKFFDPKNILAKYSFAQFDDPGFKADRQRDLSVWSDEFNSAKYSRDIQNLVGLGPYKIERWDAGQSMTLVRKQNHWTKGSTDMYETAYPEKIIIKINKDPNSQLLEFKAQAMDASTYLSTKTLLELQRDENFNKNYNSRFTDSYNYSYVAMNMKPDGIQHKKLFTDKKVRRAIALLIPVDQINKILNKGKNRRMTGPVSPLKEEYNTSLKPLPYNVEEARKMLAEAGWKDTDGDNILDKEIDGQKVPFMFNLNYMTTTVDWKDMAQMIAESMYKAGIKVNINPLDFAVHYDKAKNHDFDMMLAGWAGSSMPEDFTQIWHTSSWSSKGSNFTGFGNAETDALIDSIKYTITDSLRIPMVKRLQEVIYEEQPYVFLYANIRRNIVHKRFGNTEMYFERPGLLLNNLKLLSSATAQP